MNKLPTKQIYLLVVIITGIIALSVYSTYAIFTFEGTTGNIVSIYTPNSLEISESISEYKQITVPKNSIADFCIVLITFSGICILLKSMFEINFCIN